MPTEFDYDFIADGDDFERPYYIPEEFILCFINTKNCDITYTEKSYLLEERDFR